MMIAKNDEQKRNHLWHIVIVGATAVILIVAVFFMVRLFHSNPVQGIWQSQDTDVLLQIESEDTLTLTWSQLGDASDVQVTLPYTLEKDEKFLTITMDPDRAQEALDQADPTLTQEQLSTALEAYTNTFSYSIEDHVLILTDREYGDQMTFDQQ